MDLEKKEVFEKVTIHIRGGGVFEIKNHDENGLKEDFDINIEEEKILSKLYGKKEKTA